MRVVEASGIDLSSMKLLAGFEGGAVYTVESGGKFYLILNESTLACILDDDDLAGLTLMKYLEFETSSERSEYIFQRAWNKRAGHEAN